MSKEFEDSVHFRLREGLTEFQRQKALDNASRVIGVASITPSGDDGRHYDVALVKDETGLRSKFEPAHTSHTLIHVVPEIEMTDSRPASWKALRDQRLNIS